MRADQECVLTSPAIERIAHPSVDAEGGGTPALRLGDPWVMAPAGALSLTLSGACGFTNKSLRALPARLLGTCYSSRNSSQVFISP